MIIRAAQDIEPNTEITISYKSPVAKDRMEGRMDLQHWGFECSCIICQASKETEDSKLEQRKKFRDDLSAAFLSEDKPSIVNVKNMITSLRDIHPPSSRGPASQPLGRISEAGGFVRSWGSSTESG